MLRIETPKQVVIDKCTFQAHGGDVLCDFARNHFLILPHLLYGEIVTNLEEQQREGLVRRFRKVISSGAYWAPSTRLMIEREGRSLQPYGFLADLDETASMRERFENGQVFSEKHAADAATCYLDSARVVLENSRVVCQTLLPDILAQADARRAELEGSRERRYQFWISEIDGFNLHGVGVRAFQKYTSSPDKFCLSEEWVSWQYIRLATILDLEYAFLKKGHGGKTEHENAEHDLHDMEYVVLLSRADAILSKDKGVCELARAAFPEKDVFSSLEEVPESYRCDWAGG
jgi:hypothetical protein